MENDRNPFLINNYISPSYFCDREYETGLLLSHIRNQSNTTIFAQRRIGKTALIQHVFYLLEEKKTACIYLDIYATQNLKELTDQLANSIFQTFPETKTIGKRFRDAIKLLRPVISVDEITGSPEMTLDITKPQQIERSIPQLLQFLDKQKTSIVIAIDEFQQILRYPEKNVEAILRTVIQQLKNVHFIFCGSNQKMMHEIFNSAKRPFYSSAKTISLKKIDRKIYGRFISKHFQRHKIKVSPEAIELILDITNHHTYYTQRLCHEVFALGIKTIDEHLVMQALGKILEETESTYFQYRNLLTGSQWQLLSAIAKAEIVTQPYSGKFLKAYDLGTPASVKRSLMSLIEKEMVFHNLSVPEPYYEVQDKFLMRWLQRR
jgi:AAA+ ATPase superfamily predicted ATPase